MLSIVIVAWGRREITQRCLESIDRHLGEQLGDTVELVLVDNASPDDTLALFDAWSTRAKIVALDRNRNFAGGCNAGARAARGDVLVFLNNDTIVERGAIEALAATAAEPGVGVAGLRLHYLDGSIQHAGVAMIRIPSGPVVPHHLFHHQPGGLAATRITYDLDVVTAACFAIPRELFTQLAGFDEGYMNGWEDVDLCLRARMAGRRVVYRGDLGLWHDEGQSRGKVLGADENARRFYARWGELLDPDDELAERIFGGWLPQPREATPGAPASAVITGSVTGLGYDAAQARAVLRACQDAQIAVAAREPLPEFVEAQLSAAEAAAVAGALGRALAPGARELDPAQLPTCVPAGPAGPGGGGVLAVLPGHDPQAALCAIEAIATLDGTPVRIVPTAASTPLLSTLAARLPSAEVLTPTPSDERLRELAAQADAFVNADRDDVRDRRALAAAGAGAATVVSDGGPGHAVLEQCTTTFGNFTKDELAAALRTALASSDRENTARRVLAACGPESIGAILRRQ
jgi:GT2 family glycosyltransferase